MNSTEIGRLGSSRQMPGKPSKPGNKMTPAEWRLPAEPASVPLARHGVTDFAREHGAGETLAADVALAVSEAVSNAVVHAFRAGAPGTIEVSAALERDRLVVGVTDTGEGMHARTDSPGLGLGIPLMGQIAERLDISGGPGNRGTAVRLTFALPQA